MSASLEVRQLSLALSTLTDSLMELTTPGNTSLLAQDLDSINYILENVVQVAPMAMLHTVRVHSIKKQTT